MTPQTSGVAAPAVYLHEFHSTDTQVRQDLAAASHSLVIHVASRELSLTAHRTLTGSGLRTTDVGAVVLCAGRELSIRSSVLADQVAELLDLTHAPPVGFGGALAFYQGLFFAAAGVEAGQFSHALLLEAAVSPSKNALDIGSYATLVGTTPGRYRYRGVCFGQVNGEAEPAQAAEKAVRERFALGSERDLVYVADRAVDQGARFLAQQRERLPGSQLAIVLRAQHHYAAAHLEVVEQPPVATAERLFQGPIPTHLRRAREARFSISFLRLVVDAPHPQAPAAAGAAAGPSLLEDEILRRLTSSVRAFDEVSRLADGSFLISLPRADAAALGSARRRLERELGEIDPAGELDLQVRFFGVSVPPTELVAAEQVERQLVERSL
jgi:hypothetical protein